MEAYLAEIRMFAGTYAPLNWAFCNGQLLSISQNQPLFSLLGVMYGGDGKTTFALPDLRGRLPVSAGQGPGLSMVTQGQAGGAADVTLTTDSMPGHTHTGTPLSHSGTANSQSAVNNMWSTEAAGATAMYSNQAANGKMMDNIINVGMTGNGASHSNVQPILGIQYIICVNGIYPSRS